MRKKANNKKIHSFAATKQIFSKHHLNIAHVLQQVQRRHIFVGIAFADVSTVIIVVVVVVVVVFINVS